MQKTAIFVKSVVGEELLLSTFHKRVKLKSFRPENKVEFIEKILRDHLKSMLKGKAVMENVMIVSSSDKGVIYYQKY